LELNSWPRSEESPSKKNKKKIHGRWNPSESLCSNSPKKTKRKKRERVWKIWISWVVFSWIGFDSNPILDSFEIFCSWWYMEKNLKIIIQTKFFFKKM
jgi:hypothetical protein